MGNLNVSNNEIMTLDFTVSKKQTNFCEIVLFICYLLAKQYPAASRLCHTFVCHYNVNDITIVQK